MAALLDRIDSPADLRALARADLPPLAQGVLLVLMYTGRVGVVTLALALAINQVPRAFRYPEEKPIVG